MSASLRCAAHSKIDGGDHLVLMGRVEEVAIGSEMPFVYFRRKFHSLDPDSRDDQAGDGGGRLLVPVMFELADGWV